MSVCSATAAASSYSRGRKGRSASTARASITEQLIERSDKVNMNQNRTGTGRSSITEQLMDLTDRSRWVDFFYLFLEIFITCVLKRPCLKYFSGMDRYSDFPLYVFLGNESHIK